VRERESILAAYRAAGTPPSPLLATAINNLATALIRAERPDEALPLAEEGARMSVEQLGESHPTAAWAWGTFASALARTGRIEESRDAYGSAIAIFHRAEGDHAASIERVERERDRLMARPHAEAP
jgi:tetratricopeptide (TPR) repeat protein